MIPEPDPSATPSTNRYSGAVVVVAAGSGVAAGAALMLVVGVLTDGFGFAGEPTEAQIAAAARRIVIGAAEDRLENLNDVAVFLETDITTDEREAIEDAFDARRELLGTWDYCDIECALDEAEVLFADSPEVLDALDADTIPTSYRLDPADGTGLAAVEAAAAEFERLAGVISVEVASREQLVDR